MLCVACCAWHVVHGMLCVAAARRTTPALPLVWSGPLWPCNELHPCPSLPTEPPLCASLTGAGLDVDANVWPWSEQYRLQLPFWTRVELLCLKQLTIVGMGLRKFVPESWVRAIPNVESVQLYGNSLTGEGVGVEWG